MVCNDPYERHIMQKLRLRSVALRPDDRIEVAGSMYSVCDVTTNAEGQDVIALWPADPSSWAGMLITVHPDAMLDLYR